MIGGSENTTRRAFLARVVGGGLGAITAVAVVTQRVSAQNPQVPTTMDSSNLFAMDQSASRPVRLPPKPGARPVLTTADRDALEHRIKCQCGCTLDVYTCRTTDFTCQVSPSMHRDVMALAAGGYNAAEVLAAFVRVYGEQVLMSPTTEGFNLLGWIAPFLALAGGAVGVGALLKSWRRAPRTTPSGLPAAPHPADATPEEMARLEAVVRDDA